MKTKTHLVLGIMSGTSLDGVDYALCSVSEKDIYLEKLWSVSYPSALRKKILAAASNQLSSFETAQLHHDLGRFYALKAPKVQCDYIGLHGQTVFHNPNPKEPATYQIGDPAYLAARFNVPVVSQFRTMDIAQGGQGAPLATLFHKQVFARPGQTVCVNNLGGISNVTYLPAGVQKGMSGGSRKGISKGKILSFDTGPANMLIDYAVAKITKGKINFDHNGALGRLGISRPSLIQKWLKAQAFFKKSPPKSTGREDFNEKYFLKCWTDCKRLKLSNEDIVATFADFTAQSIALTYSDHLPQFPDLVVLCGGGAANPTLVKAITKSLREAQWKKFGNKIQNPVQVVTSEQLGWPAQSIEAAAFALLAFRTANGLTGNLPETTGAKCAAILGQITPAPKAP